MSYVLIPAAASGLIKSSSLGTSINFTEPGVFQTITSYDLQALNSFKNLLLTFPGERYLNPTFGCNLKRVIFEPNTGLVKETIENIIQQAAANFLPYINIENIKIITAEDDPTFEHYIRITIIFTVDRSEFQQKITITGTENGQIGITGS